MWQEEDLNLLVSYSTKPPSPVYTRRKMDPMGPPSSMSVGGKKKLSRENLGAMFPHGGCELEMASKATYTHTLQVVVIYWLRTSTQPGFSWRGTDSAVSRHVDRVHLVYAFILCMYASLNWTRACMHVYMVCVCVCVVCVCVCVCVSPLTGAEEWS